jgi:hypothetical protein
MNVRYGYITKSSDVDQSKMMEYAMNCYSRLSVSGDLNEHNI